MLLHRLATAPTKSTKIGATNDSIESTLDSCVGENFNSI